MPYLAFQGDHYDVHEDLRLAAIDLGAVPTPARELVRSLRSAGLRHKGAVDPWHWDADTTLRRRHVDDALGRVGLDSSELRDVCVEALMAVGGDATVRTGARVNERIVVATHPFPDVAIDVGLARVSGELAIHRSFGERGAFVEVAVGR